MLNGEDEPAEDRLSGRTSEAQAARIERMIRAAIELAGQGGYGFQTSSGIAELATILLTGADPEDLGADPVRIRAAAEALRPA